MSLEKELGFDLYGRYAIIRDIINSKRLNNSSLKILDVGGRGNLLRRFLPQDEILYLDPNIDSEDDNFIKADGCNMPLGNNSFDWVVSADVLEHIPVTNRVQFLSEKLRVSIDGIILAAPFDSPIISKAETNINDRYKSLFGSDHPWLIEHINNGLPQFKLIEDFAKSNNLIINVFSNNDMQLWEAGQELTLQASISPEIDISDFIETYNKGYLSEINSENSYRKIVVLTTVNEDLELKPTQPFSEFQQAIMKSVMNSYNARLRALESRQSKMNNACSYKAQLYYGVDNNFSESQSLSQEVGPGLHTLTFDLQSIDDISCFRFDPSNSQCSVVIELIELNYEDGIEYILPDSSNAIAVEERIFFFSTGDPNIYFKSTRPSKINFITLRCNYRSFNTDSYKEITDYLSQKCAEKAPLENSIAELRSQLSKYQIKTDECINNTRTSLTQSHRQLKKAIGSSLKLGFDFHKDLLNKTKEQTNHINGIQIKTTEKLQQVENTVESHYLSLTNNFDVTKELLKSFNDKNEHSLKDSLKQHEENLINKFDSTEQNSIELINSLASKVQEMVLENIRSIKETETLHHSENQENHNSMINIQSQLDKKLEIIHGDINERNISLTKCINEKNFEISALSERYNSLVNHIRSNPILKLFLKNKI